MLVVSGVLLGVAWAAFRDTVSSSAYFAAGSLHFGGTVVAPIEFSNVTPGWATTDEDPARTGGAPLRNAGSMPGVLRLSVERLADSENDVTPQEARLVPVDTAPEGEASGTLQVAVYDNVAPDDPASRPVWQGTLAELAEASPVTLDPSFSPSCVTGEEHAIAWRCWVPSSAGNEIQTDSVSCDIVYSLDQW